MKVGSASLGHQVGVSRQIHPKVHVIDGTALGHEGGLSLHSLDASVRLKDGPHLTQNQRPREVAERDRQPREVAVSAHQMDGTGMAMGRPHCHSKVRRHRHPGGASLPSATALLVRHAPGFVTIRKMATTMSTPVSAPTRPSVRARER